MDLLKWAGNLRCIGPANQTVGDRDHRMGAVPKEPPTTSLVYLPRDPCSPPQAINVTRDWFDQNGRKVNEFCLSAQCIAKYFSFYPPLFGQGDVLKVAPTTGACIYARWSNAKLRWGHNLNHIAARHLAV
jgi:hypothetical protein